MSMLVSVACIELLDECRFGFVYPRNCGSINSLDESMNAETIAFSTSWKSDFTSSFVLIYFAKKSNITAHF